MLFPTVKRPFVIGPLRLGRDDFVDRHNIYTYTAQLKRMNARDTSSRLYQDKCQFSSKTPRRVALRSIFRDYLVVVALSEQAERQPVNRGSQGVHASVTKNELAQVRVVAAELPTCIISLACQGERWAGSPRVADRIVSVVQAAVPRMECLRSSRHVFFTDQQGIAQAVRDLGKSDPLDGPESAVLRNGFAAKLNGVIKAGRTN